MICRDMDSHDYGDEESKKQEKEMLSLNLDY
jgi:hypothetical protein